MKRRTLKLLTVVAIAAGAAAACERSAPLTSPTSGPRMAVTAGTFTVGGYTLLSTSSGGNQTKSLIIDQSGGRINFGPNSLQVPYMAVSGPTRFTFTLQQKPYMSAQLTAVSISYDSRGKPVDGPAVTTFAKTLTLTLSYSQASTAIPDPNKLVFLWMENGVILDAYKPAVDVKGQKLILDVKHFTEYGPAIPGDNACAPSSLTPCDPNAN